MRGVRYEKLKEKKYNKMAKIFKCYFGDAALDCADCQNPTLEINALFKLNKVTLTYIYLWVDAGYFVGN